VAFSKDIISFALDYVNIRVFLNYITEQAVVMRGTTNPAPCCDEAKDQKQQFHYILSR